jgi:hypothetical protein
MIILNDPMRTFFSNRAQTKLPIQLEQKILEGFYEHINSVVFYCYRNRLEEASLQNIIHFYGDLTGFEVTMNRIYIDDYVDNNNYNYQEILNIGFTLIKIIQNQWNNLRNDECTISLSCDLESEFGTNASITFYKKRPNETIFHSVDDCIQPVFICDNTDCIAI